MAQTPPTSGGSIEDIDLKKALEERYLTYALSTIMHRALPDVRDGLKPVHRRILFAMRELRLDPGSSFKKSARVVGDVIGKYHPHGDQSVYDALVRLAQDFAQRYPLVDGQGNFGNLDGDNPAAMRYTESRLTPVAALLLDGIDDDAVDFRENYDGSEREPIVMPANFPNILANGAAGIAVGMATSIPPHNAAELCDAALRMIENPDATLEEILTFVQGPDFPTGGVIVESAEAIRTAYRTGRGSFRLRARWVKEDQGRGAWAAVITEIPYQIQKNRVHEAIAALFENKKLPLVGDIREESAEDVRLVIEPKSRTVDPNVMMESVFKLSDLEVRIPLNMNVLARGQAPMVLGLKEVLRHWLDHRKVVLVRRTQNRLAHVARRLDVLAGYLIAYLNLDEVIRIVREEDDARSELIRAFALNETQAEAVLNMRLRALRKLEEIEIRRENDALAKEQGELNALMASDSKQWRRISAEIKKVRDTFGPKTALGARRTSFGEAVEIPAGLEDAFVEREPLTVILSEKGWIRTLKGYVQDVASQQFKGDDRLASAFHAESTDKIVLIASDGRAFTLEAHKLPGGRGFGEPVKLMVDLGEAEKIVCAFRHVPGRKRLIASNEGRGFVVPEDELIGSTRKGRQVMIVEAPKVVKVCVPADGDSVAIVGENRKAVVFPLEQIQESPKGKGVRLQRYADGGLSDAKAFVRAKGLVWRDASGRARAFGPIQDFFGDRGAFGRAAPRGFPRTNVFDERPAGVVGLDGERPKADEEKSEG